MGIAFAAAIFQRIVDQIDNRLSEQLTVAGHHQAGLGLKSKRHALLFCNRFVHFGHVADNHARVAGDKIIR